MVNKNKERGNALEREIVKYLVSKGYEFSQRGWGSNGESLGKHSTVDVLGKKNGREVAIQCKRRKKFTLEFQEWLDCLKPVGYNDIVIFRKDGKPLTYYAIVKLEDIL
jgi:hypothetical protein